MVKISIGLNGEFFIDTDHALQKSEMDTIEELYRRILTARDECKILSFGIQAAGGNS